MTPEAVVIPIMRRAISGKPTADGFIDLASSKTVRLRHGNE
jgi:hypothetical protein